MRTLLELSEGNITVVSLLSLILNIFSYTKSPIPGLGVGANSPKGWVKSSHESLIFYLKVDAYSLQNRSNKRAGRRTNVKSSKLRSSAPSSLYFNTAYSFKVNSTRSCRIVTCYKNDSYRVLNISSRRSIGQDERL
jgi:hypothetical protein